ncbi:ABC transporter substrate-binding protein [Magnetospirillum sp. UT-4]|uniref:substrate-binding periplasmic protein n=1 Tax=Magnetospirillum sp. UT-4 TaxID=2681467 RepID=UPI00157468F2|nr:transporter substrate-binding domain-containing protein [Magnetospirillum sp. UT-4]
MKIIFSQYTPPYVFENGQGIVVDIVRAALAPAGYRITPVYVPIGRGVELFAERKVDGTAIIRESSGLAASYSDPFMQYHNAAFSLKRRGLVLSTVADLKDKAVVGFQNASVFLGPEFGAMAAANTAYKELANQETQTLMLLLGRIDVAVMDSGIFHFYRQKLIAEGRAPAGEDIQVSTLFPPTPYQCAFVDPVVRDAFNRGLAAIRASGRYDEIYRSYVGRYLWVNQ